MNLNLFEEDELEDDYEDFNLGKKRKVSLKDIDDVGNFGIYKGDFKKDIGVLDNLCVNFQKFELKIIKEFNLYKNYFFEDKKFEVFIVQINGKRKLGKNNNNFKVVIFMVYWDIVEYLFN